MDKSIWINIKMEYETSNISMRDISKKHGVSFSTLSRRAKKEDWVKCKTKVETDVIAKVRQNFVAKQAKAISTELEASHLISELVLKALKDENQFNKHLIQMKEKEYNTQAATVRFDKSGNAVKVPAKKTSSERQWVEEKEFSVVDTKRLKDLSAALQASTGLIRLLNNVMSAQEEANLEIAKQRLELDKLKADIATGNGDKEETGVVLLPQVDPSLQPDDATEVK